MINCKYIVISIRKVFYVSPWFVSHTEDVIRGTHDGRQDVIRGTHDGREDVIRGTHDVREDVILKVAAI